MKRSTVLTPFERPGHDHDRCVNTALATARVLCTEQGLRLTPIRRRVLELIWGRHQPVKAYDILTQLQRKNPRTAPPTVYRALEFLLEAGLVHRVASFNAYVGCGDPGTPHVGQFLICRTCNVVAEINDPRVSEMLGQDARRLGFRSEHPTVEVTGLCRQCGGE